MCTRRAPHPLHLTRRDSFVATAAALAAGSGASALTRQRRTPWTRPTGVIHKSTFAVRDPSESVRFCRRYFGATEVVVPDPALRRHGIRWVQLAGGTPSAPASELHFVPWEFGGSSGLRGGVDGNGDGPCRATQNRLSKRRRSQAHTLLRRPR